MDRENSIRSIFPFSITSDCGQRNFFFFNILICVMGTAKFLFFNFKFTVLVNKAFSIFVNQKNLINIKKTFSLKIWLLFPCFLQYISLNKLPRAEMPYFLIWKFFKIFVSRFFELFFDYFNSALKYCDIYWLRPITDWKIHVKIKFSTHTNQNT